MPALALTGYFAISSQTIVRCSLLNISIWHKNNGSYVFQNTCSCENKQQFKLSLTICYDWKPIELINCLLVLPHPKDFWCAILSFYIYNAKTFFHLTQTLGILRILKNDEGAQARMSFMRLASPNISTIHHWIQCLICYFAQLANDNG